MADRSSYFRLFLDWPSYQEGSQIANRFRCADRRWRARLSMSMNLFTFYWKAQGAVVEREGEVSRESERGEQSAIVISYPSRSRLAKRLDTGLENVNRSSTVRLDGLTGQLDCGSFLLGRDGWSTLSREGERWDHLTSRSSRGQGHGYSLSIVSKVPVRLGNATYVLKNFSRIKTTFPLFFNCLHNYSTSIFNRVIYCRIIVIVFFNLKIFLQFFLVLRL